MNDRVVCVMSVGAGKYRKQYELVRDNLMAYAKKCHADFRFIDDYIDKDKKRDIYSQKLLIPDYLREYEQCFSWIWISSSRRIARIFLRLCRRISD